MDAAISMGDGWVRTVLSVPPVLVVVVLFTIPHAIDLVARLRAFIRLRSSFPAAAAAAVETDDAYFEKEATIRHLGRTTSESRAAFKAHSARVAFWVNVLSSLLTGNAYKSYLDRSEYSPLAPPGTRIVLWLLLLAQGWTAASATPRGAYRLGSWSGVCCIGTGIWLLYTVASALDHAHLFPDDPRASRAALATGAVQGFGAILLGIAHLSLPRRPQLYDGSGRSISGQLWRGWKVLFSFGFLNPIIAVGRATGRVELSDLGRSLPGESAAAMLEKFHRQGILRRMQAPGASLLRVVALLHWKQMVIQIASGGLYGILTSAAPGWWLLRVLQAFEDSERTALGIAPDPNRPRRGPWVQILGMFTCMLLATTMAQCMHNWGWTRYVGPIRAQLAAAVSEKSLKMGAVARDDNNKPGAKKAASTVVVGDDIERATYGLRNMDSFWTFVANILLNSAQLTYIVGLWPFLAGIAVIGLTIAANGFIMKRFSLVQRSLMTTRDTKANVVREALAGIRQIKFSAAEDLWAGRIDRTRKAEMVWIRRAFVFEVVLAVLVFASPVILTVACYATYAWIEGTAPPASVTFGE
jgi:hypothetical protein